MCKVSNHVILTDDVVGAALGLSHPPFLHIVIGLALFVCMQPFTYIAEGLMMPKPTRVEVAPPEVFVEFGIIRIQKLEVMGQSFGTEKVENEMSVVRQQLRPATTCQKMGYNTK